MLHVALCVAAAATGGQLAGGLPGALLALVVAVLVLGPVEDREG